MAASKLSVLALISLTTVAGFAGTATDIRPEFQGDWLTATIEEGEETPKAAGCIPSDIGSFTAAITFDKSSGVFTSVDYIDSSDCKGDNKVVADFTYGFTVTTSTDDYQILDIPHFEYRYVISGDVTVAQLNKANVCGFSDWQAGTYLSSDARLQACDENNTNDYIVPYEEPDSQFGTQLRLKHVKGGLVIEEREDSDDDSDFDYPIYFVRP